MWIVAPGHDAIIPVDAGEAGGARGWAAAADDLDDDHATAATRTRRRSIRRRRRLRLGRCGGVEQLPGAGDIGLVGGAGEQALVPNAVKALLQNVQEKATDELVGAERHRSLAVDAVAPIVFVVEGDVSPRCRDVREPGGPWSAGEPTLLPQSKNRKAPAAIVIEF